MRENTWTGGGIRRGTGPPRDRGQSVRRLGGRVGDRGSCPCQVTVGVRSAGPMQMEGDPGSLEEPREGQGGGSTGEEQAGGQGEGGHSC